MGSEDRTRITIETEKVLILASQQATHGWCQKCGQEVQLVTAHQAKGSFKIVTEQLKAARQSKLHLGQAKNGLVICLKSLLRLLQATGADHDHDDLSKRGGGRK